MFWIFDESSFIEPNNGIGYIAVFKLKNKNNKCKTITTMDVGSVLSAKLERANHVIGRVGFWASDEVKYPDSYIFTETAQKGNCQLEIVRVYRIYIKNQIE